MLTEHGSYSLLLRAFRSSKGLDQTTLGRLIGKSQRYVSELEGGKTPSDVCHARVCRALGLAPADTDRLTRALEDGVEPFSHAASLGVNGFEMAKQRCESNAEMGMPDLALRFGLAAVELATSGSQRCEANLLVANGHSMVENPEASEHYQRQAYKAADDPAVKERITENIAHNFRREGLTVPAMLMSKGLMESEDSRVAAHARVNYVRCMLDEGLTDYEEMERRVEEAIAIYTARDEPGMASWAHITLCRVRLARGDTSDEVLDELRGLRDRAERVGDESDYVQASLEILRENQDAEEAAGLIRIARERLPQTLQHVREILPRLALAFLGLLVLAPRAPASDKPCFDTVSSAHLRHTIGQPLWMESPSRAPRGQYRGPLDVAPQSPGPGAYPRPSSPGAFPGPPSPAPPRPSTPSTRRATARERSEPAVAG